MPKRKRTTSTRSITAPRWSGINTSAFIEAAVVGKPVFTVLEPEISENNQEGTLHLQYLLDEATGVLRAARSLEEHVPQLAAALTGHGGGDPKAARFVDGFVRPFGRTRPRRRGSSRQWSRSLDGGAGEAGAGGGRVSLSVPARMPPIAALAHAAVAQADAAPDSQEVRAVRSWSILRG